MEDCPFCIKNGLLRVEILYEDDLWYVTGKEADSINNAVLAITKRHIATPFEINEAEWQVLHMLLVTMKQFVDQMEQPAGYNLGWNVHETAGQTVGHAHLHLLARYDDEPLAGRGIRYAFKQMDNKRPTA